MFGTAPRFWWSAERTLAAHLLQPAGSLYGAVAARRMRQAGRRVRVPVICVGNFVVGGAGKTPVAIAVGRALAARGERPAFLSRGYGRDANHRGVLRVDPDRHTARQAGDEPLLLARVAPTFVAADRRQAAEAAMAEGASVLVLDDGMQNPALFKDAVIAVADGSAGTGNGLCLPAGPLRAPMDVQWRTVSALCILGEGSAGRDLAAEALALGVQVLRGELRPEPTALTALRGRRLYAFSGIGTPEKFFRTLDAQALAVVGRRSFPDHHDYRAQDRATLLEEAGTLGAELVTTEKDRVRLPPDFPVRTLPVAVHFADEASLGALIDTVLARVRAPA